MGGSGNIEGVALQSGVFLQKKLSRCVIIGHLRGCLRHSSSDTYVGMLPSVSASAPYICPILTNLREAV